MSCWKCRFSGFTPHLLNVSLHFSKTPAFKDFSALLCQILGASTGGFSQELEPISWQPPLTLPQRQGSHSHSLNEAQLPQPFVIWKSPLGFSWVPKIQLFAVVKEAGCTQGSKGRSSMSLHLLPKKLSPRGRCSANVGCLPAERSFPSCCG